MNKIASPYPPRKAVVTMEMDPVTGEVQIAFKSDDGIPYPTVIKAFCGLMSNLSDMFTKQAVDAAMAASNTTENHKTPLETPPGIPGENPFGKKD